MADVSTITVKDYNGETATTQLKIADIDALNYDASTTALATYRGAITDLMLAAPARQRVSTKLWQTLTITANPLAQVENKWLVKTATAAGDIRPYTEIPTADLSLLENGSEYIVREGSVSVSDPNGYVAAFKAAFDAVAVNDAGEALVIYEIQFVGRSR